MASLGAGIVNAPVAAAAWRGADDILPESMFTLPAPEDSTARKVVRAANVVFTVSHRLWLSTLVFFMVAFSPFVGFGAALWGYMAAVFRRLMYPFGRYFADASGLGDLTRTVSLYLAWKRATLRASGGARALLPASGYRTSARTGPLMMEELSVGSAQAWARPVRWFNAGYEGGFVAGTVVVAAVTVLFAPLMALFHAGADTWVALFRGLARSDARLLTDSVGTTEVIDQGVALMLEEMGMHSPYAATLGGGSGVPPAAAEAAAEAAGVPVYSCAESSPAAFSGASSAGLSAYGSTSSVAGSSGVLRMPSPLGAAAPLLTETARI